MEIKNLRPKQKFAWDEDTMKRKSPRYHPPSRKIGHSKPLTVLAVLSYCRFQKDRSRVNFGASAAKRLSANRRFSLFGKTTSTLPVKAFNIYNKEIIT